MRLQEVIWPNKYMLISVGLWPSQRSDTIIPRFAVALFAVVCFSVTLFTTVVVNWGNMNVLGEFGGLTVVHVLVSLKILYYFLRRRSFGRMYKHIENFWNISDDPQERINYERLANVAKIVSMVAFMSGIADGISFEIVAFINLIRNYRKANGSIYHRPLPMQLVYGLDTQRTPTYELIFVWQSVSMFYSILTINGSDAILMVYIVHLAGQFKLISCRFREIGRKIDDNDDKLHTELGKLVAQHQNTIRITKELNKLLSPVMFCQFMSSGLQICLGGYAVIKGDSTKAQIITFLVFFVSLLIQLVEFCAPAELLIQESTAIADTIYHEMPWFELSPNFRRDLGFVMMRSQKGCHVTASYHVMSIRKLTEVFNAAGSYMALLRSMKVAEELKALQSPMVFGIVTSGMGICLGGYAVIEGDGSRADIKFLVFIISLLIQLFVYCAPAELLIRKSTAVAEVVYYKVPWFKLTLSLRRDLSFVMMRAQRGCHLTALYQVISKRKITEVFNAAGSYSLC